MYKLVGEGGRLCNQEPNHKVVCLGAYVKMGSVFTMAVYLTLWLIVQSFCSWFVSPNNGALKCRMRWTCVWLSWALCYKLCLKKTKKKTELKSHYKYWMKETFMLFINIYAEELELRLHNERRPWYRLILGSKWLGEQWELPSYQHWVLKICCCPVPEFQQLSNF